MMRRTAEAVAETAQHEGIERPSVIAVTVLTSADSATLAEVGIAPPDPHEQAGRLARLAAQCGLDGVVASPHEVALIRNVVKSSSFLIVTPGVRPSGSAPGDQKRVMTPAEAVRAGADYLVVGRPIIKAPDPAHAARQIIEEMR
jgi:orotidine-5'-phosphate decarboxylase